MIANRSLTAGFELNQLSSLKGARVIGENWHASWIGVFYQHPSGWCFHKEFGWIYPSIREEDGLWFWSFSFGWLWSNEMNSENNFHWSQNEGCWLLIDFDTLNTPIIYKYSVQSWFKLD